MAKIIFLCFLVCQAVSIYSASISSDSAEAGEEEYYDAEDEYSDDYFITRQPAPRSRVLFDEDNGATRIHFKIEEKDKSLNTRISSEEIIITLKEINQIFDKKKHKVNSNSKLSHSDKKKARACRKKQLLFSLTDTKCHNPTSEGPCRNNKWFVAVKGKLEGVCRRNLCTSEENPIMYDGTCSGLYESCPKSSRLYLNKRGRGFCDCDQGFSYNTEDDSCHREHTQGPCGEEETWLGRKAPEKHKTGHKVFGKCVQNKCENGEAKWKDKKCYKVDSGDMFNMCLDSQHGELAIEDKLMTCKMETRGRAVIMGAGRSCRRGRTWSSYRNRCVRVYSRG